jgi:hypothetical protein
LEVLTPLLSPDLSQEPSAPNENPVLGTNPSAVAVPSVCLTFPALLSNRLSPRILVKLLEVPSTLSHFPWLEFPEVHDELPTPKEKPVLGATPDPVACL